MNNSGENIAEQAVSTPVEPKSITHTKKSGAPSFPRSLREGDFDLKAQRSRPSNSKSRPIHRNPRPQTTTDLPPKRRGEVAEAAFLHKAASLGFSISKPWGESDRYDFILDCGGYCWRVQVKSAHTVPKNGYTFHACGNLPGQVYTAKEIDFFVAYIVPADAWYVLPIEVFATVRSVKLFPSSQRPTRSRFEKYRDAWHYFGTPKTSDKQSDTK